MQDLNDVAGLPIGLRRGQSSESLGGGDEGRNPLVEAGLPLPKTMMHELSDADQAAIANDRRKRLESKLAAGAPENGLSKRISQAGWTLITGMSVVGIVLCTLFVFSHTVQLLASLQTLPSVPRYSGYALLSGLVLVLAYYVGRLLFAVWRLRRNRQLSLRDLRELEGRWELQELAREHQHAAHEQLRQWLTGYPLEDRSHQQFLRQCGLNESQVAEMVEARRELFDTEVLGGWDTWIHKFKGCVQNRLDAAADRVVRDYATTVGVKTAISPNALVDTVVLIYSGLGMLSNLCLVYNLRLGPIAMLRLAGVVFSQAYLAGRLEELPVEDWLSDAINKGLATVSKCNLPIVGNFAGALAAPGIQGTANGMLIRRLGKHAQRLLRPVSNE